MLTLQFIVSSKSMELFVPCLKDKGKFFNWLLVKKVRGYYPYSRAKTIGSTLIEKKKGMN